MGTGLVAGMDIGGTKTQVMVSRDGVTVADVTVPTADWRTWRVADDARELAEVVRRIVGGVPDSLAVGAHGCDSDEQCLALQDALHGELGTPVLVVNDSELLVPAAGYVAGIGVVSGTGSIAVARTPDGKMLAAGGWGWILGDEGSAAALVREAAKAVRGAIDRGSNDDPLIAGMLAALGTHEATKLGRLLNEVRGAAEWGRHADVVFTAANNGSTLAHGVIEEGGKALAQLVGILLDRGATADVVVCAGGVITTQPMLLAAFTEAMSGISPRSHIVLLREPPVVGAVALAERLLAADRMKHAV